MIALWIILGLVTLFLLVIIIRAAMFKPPVSEPVPAKPLGLDGNAATDHLAQMVRLRTVSSRNPEMVDESQFEAFRTLLNDLYPNVTPVSYTHLDVYKRQLPLTTI